MVRREDGRPWFIHGVGFDITELKQTEVALAGERNLLSAVLDTVGALVVVLSPSGSIVRFNRTCELISGYSFDEVRGRYFWDLFPVPEEARGFQALLEGLRPGTAAVVRERLDRAWRRRGAGSPGPVPCCRARRGARARHHDRDRHHRAQGDGIGAARDQRPGAAADRPGPARRAGPAPDRHRVHEQGAGAAAGRGGRDPGAPRGQDRPAGERRHQQDPRAGPRPGTGVLGRRRA